MSLSVKNQTCPICGGYLFDEDDIVFCPVCGAPHHRDCYNSTHECGLNELHGTDKQFDSSVLHTSEDEEKKENHSDSGNVMVRCRACGENYSISEERCPECGAPNMVFGMNMGKTFNVLGGVPEELDIGENVTAIEAGRFVAIAPNKIIPKFAKFKNGSKTSFNIWAFLFPSGWLGYRKCYRFASLFCAFEMAASLLIYPLIIWFNQFLSADNMSYMNTARIFYENIANADRSLIILAAIGAITALLTRIIASLFGDRILYKEVITKISNIKKNSEDSEMDFAKKSGVNFFAFFLFYFAVSYLPEIIAALFIG